MTILFVCTGNTCRSPMAAALLRHRLDKMGKDDIIVESAGLAASGEPASENARLVMEEIGLSLADHLSRQITPALCEKADLIGTMSPRHKGVLVSAYGVDADKVRVLGAPDGIDDPYGGDLSVYRQTRDQLEAVLNQLADSL